MDYTQNLKSYIKEIRCSLLLKDQYELTMEVQRPITRIPDCHKSIDKNLHIIYADTLNNLKKANPIEKDTKP